MGMVLGMVSVRDATIRRLLADPPLVWKLLAPDDPEPYEEARADSDVVVVDDDLELEEAESEHLDLDKAWHGLHWMLTGTAWEGEAPLNMLVCGGVQIGDIDIGYGSARALTAQEVAQAHRALASLPDASIRSRFDPPAMLRAEIYPSIWDRRPDQDDTLGYLMEYLGALRQFLARQTAAGMGVVVSIS